MESKAFQELLHKLDKLIGCIQSFIRERDEENKAQDTWLDSKEVCRRLNISTRTLYRLKTERQISFTMLRGRCRFSAGEVEQLLRDGLVGSHPDTLDELRQGYSFK